LSYSTPGNSPPLELVEITLTNTETGETQTITRPADNTAVPLENLPSGTKFETTIRSKAQDGRYSDPTSPIEFTTSK